MNEPVRVLLVENDPDDYLITSDLVEDIDDASYILDWKKTYDSGLTALRTGPYGACLLDFRLGERNGLEFLRAAQAWENAVPIILFTNNVNRAMERDAMAAGAADHLLKTGTNHESLRRALRFAMERNRATSAAREGDRLFRAIFDHSLDAMLITDPTGMFIDANAAALEMTGLSRDKLLGGTVANFGARNVEAATGDGRWDRFLKDGHSSGALEVLRPDGSLRHVEFSGTARVLPEKHLFVLRDVTEQKALQARMAISDRMASVGTLAAGLAHEINNPLAAVVGYLDMAVEALNSNPGPPPNPAAMDFLKRADEAAQRVSLTVKDLKLFSRGQEERKSCVDLSVTMEASLRMAWNEIRHRALVAKNFGDAPFVWVNESRLGQVFLNLLVNAAQAIPPGFVDGNLISVGIRSQDGRVEVEIADTGVGIPPKLLPKIFDAFYSTKDVKSGTGLGLAICKGIVEEMGGQISVKSEVGRGTTFTLRLPKELACEPPQHVLVPPVAGKGRRGKILIVDDEAGLLKIMAMMLSQEHETVAIQDPREALARLEKGETYDAILCDMMMPQMTGMEFYQRLEFISQAQARKLIFVSGGAFTVLELKFMESAGRTVIEKPFGRAELVTKVRAVVGV